MNKNIFHNNKSHEKRLDKKLLSNEKNLNQKMNVDINMLLNRVKINKKNETKKNIILFSWGILILSFMGVFVLITK